MSIHYEIIFPQKTFISLSNRREDIQDAIILKNHATKYVLLDKGKKRGRMYWGNARQLDFIVRRVFKADF